MNYFEDETFLLTLINAGLNELSDEAKKVVTQAVRIKLEGKFDCSRHVQELFKNAQKKKTLELIEVRKLKNIMPSLTEAVRGRTNPLGMDGPVPITYFISD